MTTNRPNPSDFSRYEPTREDILIGRVVDGEATPSDWGELEHMSKADAALWQRLAQSQRAHARLERAVEDEIAVSELVELPEPVSVIASFRSRWQLWGGWAVAAGLALAWLGAGSGPAMFRPNGSGNSPSTLPAGLGTAAGTLDDLLNQYVTKGRESDRVVNVMPLQLLKTNQLEQGKGTEVFFVRPIIERMIVTDFRPMSVLVDEAGQARKVMGSQPIRVEDLTRPASHD
jgi:hypothetical protein